MGTKSEYDATFESIDEDNVVYKRIKKEERRKEDTEKQNLKQKVTSALIIRMARYQIKKNIYNKNTFIWKKKYIVKQN